MKRTTVKKLFSLFLAAFLMGAFVAPRLTLAAEAKINTGTTKNFAVLAGETITNTGSTEITGDVGLYAGTAVPGASDVTLTGEWHLSDAVALTAKNDLITAYDDAAGRSPQIISRELGGQTLTPGVYVSNEKDFLLNGKLTLDGQGDPDAIFIFQTDTDLVTASESSVVLMGEATPCGVFWKIGSSATIGSYSDFAGRILALTSITLETGAEVRGQLLSRNGSVTLDSNKIISGPCAVIQTATLHIIKLVVDADDETVTAGDFSIHVLKDGLDVEGSPSAGMDAPGRSYTLDAGSYTVKESSVEGYHVSFSGDSTDGTVILAPGEEKTIIITNTAMNGIIVLEKTDEEGNPLAGAEFTLYKDTVAVGDTMVSDAVGMISFTGLEKGTYTLMETKAPEGYVLSEVIEEIIIDDDHTAVEVFFTNTRITAQVNIRKVDAESRKVLAGAEFLISDKAGHEYFRGKTDESGLISTTIPYGEYIIVEVTAPKNYTKSDKKYVMSITENGQIFNLEVKNTRMVEKTEVLPAAGNTSGMMIFLMGILAVSGGVLLLKKRNLA